MTSFKKAILNVILLGPVNGVLACTTHVATETARERFRRIEDTENQVLGFNLYGIPTLVILALVPHARRKKSELVAAERAGSG